MKFDSTRLRYIQAGSADDLTKAISLLPFKVEIKGGPVKDGKKWIAFFVIPDHVENFDNVEV